MDSFEGRRCREKRGKKCMKEQGGSRPRGFAGICCIAAGILVMICFVPGWLVAIIAAFILFSVGFYLVGLR